MKTRKEAVEINDNILILHDFTVRLQDNEDGVIYTFNLISKDLDQVFDRVQKLGVKMIEVVNDKTVLFPVDDFLSVKENRLKIEKILKKRFQ